MNKVILIGRLGQNPELKFTQSNMQVCTFSVATSKKLKGEEKTEWHNIVSFDKTAEIANTYLKKGSLVAIEGSLSTSNYDKDGQKHYRTQIICDRLEMLGGKSDNEAKQTVKVDMDNIEDGLPF